MANERQNEFEWTEEEQDRVMNSIRANRIIVPVLLGISVVGYMFYKQFDPEEFATIQWNTHTLFWVIMCVFLLGLRHFAYMLRLSILTQGFFKLRKCFELIFVWEFSSAISPTSVGGSAVALLALAQEKLPAAKTAAIVIYSVVLDTAFFVLGIPILFLFLGDSLIAPAGETFEEWRAIFLLLYTMMATYGVLFFYGLFISPKRVKQFLMLITKNRFLKRFREKWTKLGDEIILASKELKMQKWTYHLGSFVTTAIAWSCRFLLINCLIIAFVTTLDNSFMTHLKIFSRLESMYVITSLIPTPGSAGGAEYVFKSFLSDYVPVTRALTIALIWRTLTYYFYLLAGAVIVPNWLRKVINKRRITEDVA